MHKTLLIRGKECRIKYTLRGLLMYEQITGSSFKGDKMLNLYTLLYCLIIVNNPDLSLTFGDFVDCIDEDPELEKSLAEWVTEESKRRSLISGVSNSEKADDSKKK